MLEIELNESLRRRYEELLAKIDALGESREGDSSSAADLETRTRELKTLTSSIEALTKRNRGTHSCHYLLLSG